MQNGLAPVDPGCDHQDGHRIEGARVVRQAPADEHEAAGFARARVASDESTPVRADDRLEFARIVETPTPQGRRAAMFDAMRSVGEIGWLAAKPRSRTRSGANSGVSLRRVRSIAEGRQEPSSRNRQRMRQPKKCPGERFREGFSWQ